MHPVHLVHPVADPRQDERDLQDGFCSPLILQSQVRASLECVVEIEKPRVVIQQLRARPGFFNRMDGMEERTGFNSNESIPAVCVTQNSSCESCSSCSSAPFDCGF